jgi:choline dehydrogenase-like flavoprotein
MSERHQIWDAVVVGSGATGATAARQLTKGGLRVLVLEAGTPLQEGDYGDFLTNGTKLLWRHFVSKRQRTQEAHPTYWNTNPDLFVDDVDNPYTTPEGKPFRWIRSRRLGGRTLVWDAVTPRFSDFDFKAAEVDGYGTSWPITHADLAPYYADLERLLGVHGSKEGIPQLPDGEFLEPRPMTPAERIFKERVEKEWGDRKVIISRGLRAGRSPMPGSAYSRMSSPVWALEEAGATGRLSVRTGAVVARVLVGRDGRATGVEFIDTSTRLSGVVRARVVFLCASTIETLRILMNSKSAAHPDGLGASSGVLGRGLMDHSAGNVYFTMPDVPDDGTKYDLLGSDSIMIPRYQNLGKQTEPYLRGFGVWGGIQRLPVPKFLHKNPNVAFGFLCARSEVLPHPDNRVELHPELKDAWGIPAAHITCEWKEHDRAVAEAGRLAVHEMVEAAGGKPQDITEIFHMPFVKNHIGGMQKEWKLSTPGMFVHEVGGARMGTSPKDSVLNPFNQVWDAPNVFVTDGAAWPTSGWQNPTLTEMAITARACDFAIEALRRGDL